MEEEHVTMRVFVDRSVIEIYLGGAALTVRSFPSDPEAAKGVELFSEGGAAVLTALEVWRLGSRWPAGK